MSLTGSKRVTRTERHEQVKALRAQGRTFKEIAAELGLATSTVTAAYYDPEGAKDKERKARRSRPCLDCGKTVKNSGSEPPERCLPCRKRHEHETRRWTPEALIAEVRRFHDQYGRPPRELDWNPRPSNIIRRTNQWVPEGFWPSSSLAAREFGSWNRMIEAAGFRPFDHELDHTWARGRPIHVAEADRAA